MAPPTDRQIDTDASDAVVPQLWQATPIVSDLAVSACLRFDPGTPSRDADALRRLAGAGILDSGLAGRLARAAGFRNVVVHADEGRDLARVHRAAREGPADLDAFLAALGSRL
jgi:uncharacterized protein YutE (UPF0331/DUF86 family)